MLSDNLEQESTFSFWKNLVLTSVFFTLTPLVLLISLFSLISIRNTDSINKKISEVPYNISFNQKSGVKVFASLPSDIPSVGGSVLLADARTEILRQYLASYNSPLEPHANLLVSVADRYGLDFRLLTAIAQQESNLCKIIPPGSYNCWGWGIHSRGTLGFASFEEGIETVAKGLKEEYLDKGYLTPDEIMTKYAPLSNGSWAYGVNKFMSDME